MSVSKKSLSELPLLTDAEKRHVLLEWNDTQSDYAQDQCIHELFHSQAERTPDAVALVFMDQHLTYWELNRRANQLAYHLQTLGVGPEVLVGICAERSLELVVGLYGILKAGGAYVPLDPSYPQERLAFILADTQVPILLTQQHLLEHLPNSSLPHLQSAPQVQVTPYSLLPLDTAWPIIARELDTAPDAGVGSDNLAYVIYTSGSTGKPKGVAILHRGVVNYLSWCQQAYPLAAGQGAPVHSSISFDLTVTSLFAPLMAGRRVQLLPEDVGVDLLGQALRDATDYSLVKITPAHLQLLNQQLSPQEAAGRTRAFIIGGESLLAESLIFWQEHAPDTLLVNEYGPTETVVGCCVYQVPPGEREQGAVPIGRPIFNTQLYILDVHLDPVPVGTPGELYVGGDGLGRGYLNRPELTAQRFIANPFIPKPGARLYKTGDLAFYRPDGEVVFLGRTDHQVKIRGFRVELGEIEATLRQHPAVQESVVLTRKSEFGDKQLVAYVVVIEGESAAISELRSFLLEKLPNYMLPSAFVTLPALPLTSNGKINRRALPAPDVSRRDLETSFAPPRTATEKILAAIWAKVLGLKHIGVHDSFVELGGHSLLAVQIIFQVRDALQVELSVTDFFHSSTVAALARTVEAARGSEPGRRIPPIKPVSRHLPIPLSFQQQQLWFFAQLYPKHPVYNETFAIHMSGDIDAAVLEQCLTELVRRHEILRTTFATVDDLPVQIIHPPAPFYLPLADFCELPRLEREAEALRWATRELRQPFDLTQGPLFRATLMRLGETDYRLFLAMHHIIMDGVSIYNVFFPELETFYIAFSEGRPLALPELELQHADFAAWQQRWLSEEILAEHLAYWEAKLADLPTLRLPTDYPRPTEATFRGARQCLALSGRLTEQLKALSRQQGVTLFVTLASAIVTLLHRYSAQEDVVIGTFTAGRDRSEIKGVMGDLLNTMVLRTDLSGNPTFRQLLQRVQDTTLEAYAHQDLPFGELVAALQPERRINQNPLFQVVFVIEPSLPKSSLGWTLSQLDVHSGTSKMDLTVELEERQGCIIGRIEYSTALFKATTIKRLIGHIETLLEGIVSVDGSLDQRLTDLPFLTDTERRQILVTWNDTRADYPIDRCIHQLFEQQGKRTPDAVAVVFMDQHLTYRGLNRRANQLAHHLQRRGVAPESVVGICLARSPEMVVSLLGVLKAGAAYVPLDPAYPQERLAFMLADTQAQVLLTQQHLLDHLSTPLLPLDDQWDLITQESAVNPSPAATPDNLAYVIYTSGSTGQPKGVAIAQRSAVALIHWAHQVFGEGHLAGTLAATSICFDLSIFELFVTLSWGGTVILAETALQLPVLPAAGAVTLVNTVPSALRELLRSEGLPPAVRTVNLAGEPLPTSLVRELYARESVSQVFDLYGPSEDTTYSTYALRSVEGPDTIGRPVANTRAYVLDPYLNPVPVGVPGELYLGGEGLARGYLRRPGQTAGRFVPHPFPPSVPPRGGDERGGAGARLYKTGDLARYLPGGQLEFLGRLDHQVKLRGFRIELGEIEAALAQHPSVQDAVVVARELAPGDEGLVAYVVPADQSPLADQLRGYLKQRLPGYMIPSLFMTLETLPLTPNGKLDRSALPAPDRPAPEESFVAPRTLVEETLAQIWAQVLGVEQVGVYDDFFALGGHSLLATRILFRVCSACQVDLPLKRFLETPTVAHLAQSIELMRWVARDVAALSDVPASQPEGYEEGEL